MLFGFFTNAQKPLDVEGIKNWDRVKSYNLSNLGLLFSIEVENQQEERFLQYGSVGAGVYKTQERGKSPKFTPGEELVMFTIAPNKALVDSIKLAKQNKLKNANKAKTPEDTLGVYFFELDTLLKFNNLVSYKVPADSGNYFAIHLKKSIYPKIKEAPQEEEKQWWKFFEKEKPAPKEPKKHKPTSKSLVIGSCLSPNFEAIENVKAYEISNGGNQIAYIKATTDTLDSLQIMIYKPQAEDIAVFKTKGEIKSLEFDYTGRQLVFLHSIDTNKQKQFELKYLNLNQDSCKTIVEGKPTFFPDGYSLSEHGKVFFSESGNKIFFGYGKQPELDKKDTILKEDLPQLDIWSWTDNRLQPHQLKELKGDLNQSFDAFYHTQNNKVVLLGDTTISSLRVLQNAESEFGYAVDRNKFLKSVSWEYPSASVIYSVNMQTGELTTLLDSHRFQFTFSPDGKYLAYYKDQTKSWFLMDVTTQKSVDITSQIQDVFYDVEHDTPSPARAYGIAGWGKENKQIIIKGGFDLWVVEVNNPSKFYCLTKNDGKNKSIRYRPFLSNTEEEYYNLNNHVNLLGFSEITKENQFYRVLRGSLPEKWHVEEGYTLNLEEKTRFGSHLIFTKQNFNTFPDAFLTNPNFSDVHRLTNLNPQQKDYAWGNVELIKFKKDNGEELEGLVFLPDNFDKTKQYHSIVYFYETYSDRYKSYFAPRLSASIINPSHYASNGYVVFIPDITYTDGYPGKNAVEAVVAGTKYVTEKYNLHPEKIGIQGQSWGGYQTAFIITQTNMFKAAMAGAPVSNMTSAYGGIRWGSGYSRMFQYENTQSRIGKTLWDATELYIYNSPLFYANQVNTPLLIMHNDNDGAVPWYQGIEYFVALRRLNKPVWMLTYNNEEHNLRKAPNKEDLTIRMMQFFDYYLKDAPAPSWLVNGLPAIKKGKEYRYELIDE
mgnify:FL=1